MWWTRAIEEYTARSLEDLTLREMSQARNDKHRMMTLT